MSGVIRALLGVDSLGWNLEWGLEIEQNKIKQNEVVVPRILREEVGTGHLEHLHRSWDALKARPGTSQNHHFCLHLGISSPFFFSLCFSIVSVEKVELKGLAHKKNERNVEYSFEVSFGFLSYERRMVLREELRKCSNFMDCLSQKCFVKAELLWDW